MVSWKMQLQHPRLNLACKDNVFVYPFSHFFVMVVSMVSMFLSHRKLVPLEDQFFSFTQEFAETDEGWFVCSGPESSDEPEAVQWQLCTEPSRLLIQCEISLGLDAKANVSGELQDGLRSWFLPISLILLTLYQILSQKRWWRWCNDIYLRRYHFIHEQNHLIDPTWKKKKKKKRKIIQICLPNMSVKSSKHPGGALLGLLCSSPRRGLTASHLRRSRTQGVGLGTGLQQLGGSFVGGFGTSF